MQAHHSDFTRLISGSRQFIIPVFQRDYSWSEAECEQLLKDIYVVVKAPQNRGHFLGAFVYVSTEGSFAGFQRWLMIDGQQRLTTLTLLLLAMRDHIQETGWEGSPEGPTARRIDAAFLKNLQEQGERSYKLLLRRGDQQALKALIDGDDRPARGARVLENYDFFRDQLKDGDPETIFQGLERLQLVDVTLDRTVDDPQLIFESLNSTGMDLSQSDLIRNFILMRQDAKEQDRFYETYWKKIEDLFHGAESVFDAYARDYIALRSGSRKQEKANQIYFAFRRFWNERIDAGQDVDDLLSDMLQCARYYAAFGVADRETDDDIGKRFDYLRKQVDLPAILVMRLYECYDSLRTLSREDFLTAISLIDSYVFRRAVCGEQTRGYWQIFSRLAQRVKDDKPLESLLVNLAALGENYKFVGDEELRRELETTDLYGKRVCKICLERLENDNQKEQSDTSGYSIEHVLPQNDDLRPQWRAMLGEDWREIQRTWLHRLGNLTLTGYNSTYSDRPFEEKKSIKGGFNDSAVRLNRYIREQDSWGANEIRHRGEQLAKRALEIWPSLQVSPELVKEAKENELREMAAAGDVSKVDMTPEARDLFDNFQSRMNEIGELGTDIFEVAHKNSVSYHGPDFFMEVLPRVNRLVLLLEMDYNEVEDPKGIAEDATQWTYFKHATHQGGVNIAIYAKQQITDALPIIRQARELVRT